MISVPLENFLFMLLPAEKRQFLSLEKKQPFPLLMKSYKEIFFLSELMQKQDGETFDLIFGDTRTIKSQQLDMKLLIEMLNPGGRLVISLENQFKLGFLKLWLFKQAAAKCRKNIKARVHIVYPSALQPNITCSEDKKTQQWFFENVYPQPKSCFKAWLFRALVPMGLFHYLVPAYLLEFEV